MTILNGVKIKARGAGGEELAADKDSLALGNAGLPARPQRAAYHKHELPCRWLLNVVFFFCCQLLKAEVFDCSARIHTFGLNADAYQASPR